MYFVQYTFLIEEKLVILHLNNITYDKEITLRGTPGKRVIGETGAMKPSTTSSAINISTEFVIHYKQMQLSRYNFRVEALIFSYFFFPLIKVGTVFAYIKAIGHFSLV